MTLGDEVSRESKKTGFDAKKWGKLSKATNTKLIENLILILLLENTNTDLIIILFIHHVFVHMMIIRLFRTTPVKKIELSRTLSRHLFTICLNYKAYSFVLSCLNPH